MRATDDDKANAATRPAAAATATTRWQLRECVRCSEHDTLAATTTHHDAVAVASTVLLAVGKGCRRARRDDDHGDSSSDDDDDDDSDDNSDSDVCSLRRHRGDADDAVAYYRCPVRLLQAASTVLRRRFAARHATHDQTTMSSLQQQQQQQQQREYVVRLPSITPACFETVALYCEHFYGDSKHTTSSSSTPGTREEQHAATVATDSTTTTQTPTPLPPPLPLQALYHLSSWEQRYVLERLLQLPQRLQHAQARARDKTAAATTTAAACTRDDDDDVLSAWLHNGAWVDALAGATSAAMRRAGVTLTLDARRDMLRVLYTHLRAATRLGIVALTSLCAALVANMLVVDFSDDDDDDDNSDNSEKASDERLLRLLQLDGYRGSNTGVTVHADKATTTAATTTTTAAATLPPMRDMCAALCRVAPGLASVFAACVADEDARATHRSRSSSDDGDDDDHSDASDTADDAAAARDVDDEEYAMHNDDDSDARVSEATTTTTSDEDTAV